MLTKMYAHDINLWREAFHQGGIMAFSVPYTSCHSYFRNTCYVYIVHIRLNLSPLNYLLTNFRVYLPFLHCFFPLWLPTKFCWTLMRSSSKARPCINWMSFVNCVCKMYSSVLSHCPTSCLAEPGPAHSPCSGSPRVTETLSQINMQKLLKMLLF